MTTDTATRRRRPPAGPLALWFGILGAAAAWAAQLSLGDMVAELGCEAGGPSTAIQVALLVISALATVVAAWALVVAWRANVELRDATGEGVPVERASFMALAGVLSSSLFLLLIVLGGFAPHLFLETCGA
jgi:hypothetical protein